MNRLINESMKEASRAVGEQNATKAAARQRAVLARPRLSRETMMECIDWTLDNASILERDVALHMQAIELAIRTLATDAQGKATQHTLVEDGVIAPPPTAS